MDGANIEKNLENRTNVALEVKAALEKLVVKQEHSRVDEFGSRLCRTDHNLLLLGGR